MRTEGLEPLGEPGRTMDLASNPKVRDYPNIARDTKWQAPTAGTRHRKRGKRETDALWAQFPNAKDELQIKNNTISTPVTVSGIHSHSRQCTDSVNKCNVQLPSSRGTMIRTLTLQVTRNLQHDTSRPSVQLNHQDYVSSLPPI